MANKQENLWTRNFILILLTNFSFFASFYMLLPTLPMYIKFLSGTNTLSGLAMGIFLISAVFTRPFAGVALDTHGRKGILLLGLLIFFITALSFNYASTLVLLFFFRFIQGFGWGYANTATGTIAADVVPKSRLAEGMGYFALSMSIAMSVAPAVSLFLVKEYGYNLMFIVSSAVVLLAIVLASLIRHQTVIKEATKVKKVLFEKAALRPSLVILLVTMNYSSVVTFLAMYGQSLKIADIGLFFTVFAICIIVLRPILGPLADRRGYDLVIIPGLLLMGVTTMILWKAQTLPAFVLAGIIFGIGFGAVQPTLQAMSVLIVTPERRGAATGTYLTFFDIGVGAGSVLWGWVAHSVGYSTMYLLATLPTLAAFFVYLLFSRQAKVKSQQPTF